MNKLKFSKEKQVNRSKRKKPILKVKEADLQRQANDMLNAYQIKYIRIPDSIHAWITKNAPEEVKIFFRHVFGGIPDNVCLIPITEKYNLALCLELKSATGKLHGKQKHWKKELAVQISRSTTETIGIIEEYLEEAAYLKEVYKNKFGKL